MTVRERGWPFTTRSYPRIAEARDCLAEEAGGRRDVRMRAACRDGWTSCGLRIERHTAGFGIWDSGFGRKAWAAPTGCG